MKQALILVVTCFLAAFNTVNCCTSQPVVTCNPRYNGIARFTGINIGDVTFTYIPGSTSYRLTGQVSGFTASAAHGVHVHEFGNIGNRCQDAGGHYNPNSQNHGGPTSAVRHAGDLGNFDTDTNGVMHFDLTIKADLLGGCNAIIGRALVIHARRDDLGLGGDEESLTTGNSGARVDCAAIGIA